jgi:hypothetical protein
MKRKNVSEQLDDLKSIVDRAQGVIKDKTPESNQVDFRLKWLLDRDFRKHTFEQNPTCIASIKTANTDIPLLPICNRSGAEDPKMLATGLVIAKSLVGIPGIDQEHLQRVIKALLRKQG